MLVQGTSFILKLEIVEIKLMRKEAYFQKFKFHLPNRYLMPFENVVN